MEEQLETAKDIRKFDISTGLPNSSFSIVLGKRRSGKSVFVGDMIKKLTKKHKLDCAFLFSGTDADFDMIDRPYRFSEIDQLHTILKRYQAMCDYNKISDPANKFRLRSMIVIDDLVLKLKGNDFKILENLACNGRHSARPPLCLHIVILAQNLTSIPRIVRNNCDCIFLNNIASRREKELIFDEQLYMLASSVQGRKDARKLYDDLMAARDFTFMCILNYRQNARRYSDYLCWYVADL